MVIPCSPASTGFALSSKEFAVLTGPDWRIASKVLCTAQPGMSLSLVAGLGTGSYRQPVPSGRRGLQRALRYSDPRRVFPGPEQKVPGSPVPGWLRL